MPTSVNLKRNDLTEMGMKHPCRVVHRLCGGMLFWYDGVPQKDLALNPAKTILPNGVHPAMGDQIMCSECNFDVLPNGMDWIIYD